MHVKVYKLHELHVHDCQLKMAEENIPVKRKKTQEYAYQTQRMQNRGAEYIARVSESSRSDLLQRIQSQGERAKDTSTPDFEVNAGIDEQLGDQVDSENISDFDSEHSGSSGILDTSNNFFEDDEEFSSQSSSVIMLADFNRFPCNGFTYF